MKLGEHQLAIGGHGRREALGVKLFHLGEEFPGHGDLRVDFGARFRWQQAVVLMKAGGGARRGVEAIDGLFEIPVGQGGESSVAILCRGQRGKKEKNGQNPHWFDCGIKKTNQRPGCELLPDRQNTVH